MPNPFPGMDPYIEARGRWPDFHHEFISQCRAAINARLPSDYVATINQRLPIAERDQPPEAYIEVCGLPEFRLVSVIEVLSPSDKVQPGYAAYREKQKDLLHRSVNLVEIDLLLVGKRLATPVLLPPGDFYAIVTRAERNDRLEVYPLSVRQPLPKIRVPLRAKEPDLALDLAEVLARTYEAGRYDRLLRHSQPVELQLSPSDVAWVRERAATGGRA